MIRRGFALVAVIVVVAATAGVAAAAVLLAREAVSASRNRVAQTRTRWQAMGCAERTRRSMDSMLTAGASWEALATAGRDQRLVEDGCRVELRPAGGAMNVNEVGEDRLVGLFISLGASPSSADSLAQAMLDWRDADDDPRPHGAERDWYQARGLPGPRNGPLAAALEIKQVRGFDDLPALDTLLDVESGPVPVNLAPLAVVASLPGMTDELAQELATLRLRGSRLRRLAELLEMGSPDARRTMAEHYQQLTLVAALDPRAWLLRASTRHPGSAVESTIELQLLPADHRVAIVRVKQW